MIYKKNWFTYLGYTLFGLLLVCLIFLSSGLHIEFSENNLIKNLIVVVPVVVCAIILWFASFLFSTLSNKLNGEKAGLLYNIVIVVLFAASIGVRAYYVLTYTDAFSAGGSDLLISALACMAGVLKLVFVYLIGVSAFGRQGAAAALFLEGFLAGEIESCAVLDYRNVSILVVLGIILLYSVYYKRCNNGKMSTAVSWLIIVIITVIISAGIGVSIYMDYSIAVPAVLAAALILSMLFAGWKQALVPLLGIPALCAAAYFGVYAADESYGTRLDNEIEYRMSNIEKIFDEPEDTFNEICEYVEHSVMFDDSLTFTIPGGYEYNHDVLLNMVFMFLSLCSLIFLFLKKRSPMSAYILFTVGVYLFDSNIVLCNIFVVSLCFQELYEGRDRISYIVNSSVIDIADDDFDIESGAIEDIYTVPEAAVSDEATVQDDSDSVSKVKENNNINEHVNKDEVQSIDENTLYKGSSVNDTDSLEEASSTKNYIYEDSIYEESTVYGVTETYDNTAPEYGVTEPLDLKESDYADVETQDNAGSDYCDIGTEYSSGTDYGTSEEISDYSGSNYGTSGTEYDSVSVYGSSEDPSEYTDSDYGTTESVYGSVSEYGSSEDPSEFTDSGYGTTESEYGSASAYGSSEEPSEYTGLGYGTTESEYGSVSGYGSYGASEDPSEYTGSAYGAVKTDEYSAQDVLDKLPVPKPVSVYVDDNTENIILKKSSNNEKETVDKSFDKDIWQNRRKRATKHTEDDTSKGDLYG